MTEPALSGIAVHWRDEAGLADLIAAWPSDPRFELVVVDNGGGDDARERLAGGAASEGKAVRWISPGSNLGFAGGANRGVAQARGEILLLLNPDARPEPGALEALLEGFSAHPDAAGLAPRLEAPGGAGQWRWQLKPLPSPGRLVLEGLFLPAARGPDLEPAPGTPVEQPAAAALALRREAWLEVGGLDPGYYPAWFEDVDLARRLAAAGRRILYWPAARFRHGLGSTVPRLGFGPFLWIYYRNLVRYLERGHGRHGRLWAAAARAVIPAGMALRLVLLPAKRPRRASTRMEAAAALAAAALGALSGWRRPRRLARAWTAAETAAAARPAGEATW